MPLIHLFITVLLVLNQINFIDDESLLIPPEVCLSEFESALYAELNNYRSIHNLPPIPISRSLTLVAQVHCRDLAVNQPHKRSNCNMHSWSGNRLWSACCYTPDHKRSACMWDKPRELTPYTGDGFEIAFHSTATYSTTRAFTEAAIGLWSKSKGHNDVIVNRGTWKNVKWKAVGVGYYGGFATVWFGMVDDPDPVDVEMCR